MKQVDSDKFEDIGSKVWVAGGILGLLLGYKWFGVGGAVLFGILGIPIGWMIGVAIGHFVSEIINNWENLIIFFTLAALIALVLFVVIYFWDVK